MYTRPHTAATVTPPVRASSFPQIGALPCFFRSHRMRHLLRLTSLLLLAGCATTPTMLAYAGIGCERAEHGAQSRTIAIYTRVVAEKVCVVDASGRCHPRVDGSAVRAEVRLPTSQSALMSALQQELGRRGILARIARPRGPKTYVALGDAPNDSPILELGDIHLSADEQAGYVMLLASGRIAADDPMTPGGEVMRLTRTEVPSGGLSRRMVSPLRTCWRLERSNATALAE